MYNGFILFWKLVTNFQSKRKTPTCISFYRNERLFGSDSYALMGRKPELSFAKIYRMLGRLAEHPLVTEIGKQYFPYEIYTNQVTRYYISTFLKPKLYDSHLLDNQNYKYQSG